MSDKNTDEIKRLIDHMQSGLVELFDQLRELRRRLGLATSETTADSQPSVVQLFSEIVSPSSSAVRTVGGFQVPSTGPVEAKPAPADTTTRPAASSVKTEAATSESEIPAKSARTGQGTAPGGPEPKLSERSSEVSATVARVLDPIAHEVRTGEASAQVIAEYLQAAKDYLITKENPNEKVANDMEVVDRFLRARGNKGIRPEERDNILRRIRRWSIMLSR